MWEKTNIIHFIKADSGDCILLQLDNKKSILIDCGYKSTYEKELRPVLKEISSKGYRISLFIVTHYDEDHIGGANALIKENGDCLYPQIIPIDEIWFNGIFTLIQSCTLLKKHIVSKLTHSKINKYKMLKEQFIGLIGNGEGLISAKLAEAFENICKQQHYNINGAANGGCILSGVKLKIGECTVKCLNPRKEQLERIAMWVDRTCISVLGKDYELDEKDFCMFLQNMLVVSGREAKSKLLTSAIGAGAPNIDDWIGTSTKARMNNINRASIVVEIIYKDRKLLFSGDSDSSDWIKNTQAEYDYVKISHHGTTRPNIALLDNVKINAALISTNGRRNHPEDEMLARLIKSGVSEIYFNYNIRRRNDLLRLTIEHGFKAYFGNSKIYF